MNDTVTISFWGKSGLIFRINSTFYPNYHVGDIIYLTGKQFKIVKISYFVIEIENQGVFNLDVEVKTAENYD